MARRKWPSTPEQRERRNAYHREWYQRHLEQERKRSREKLQKRKEADPEAYAAYYRAYDKANPDKAKAKARRYYWRHRDEILRNFSEGRLRIDGDVVVIGTLPDEWQAVALQVKEARKLLKGAKHNG
jgi:hypothetical protein